MKNTENRKFIGRVEKVNLTSFDIKGLKAKIDTGAYSVAIHAENIRLENDELVFNLLDSEHPMFQNSDIKTKDFRTKRVRSSNGSLETRYLIITKLNVGGVDYEVEATLTNRKSMKYPILIGRKFLRQNDFFVDVNSAFLQKTKKK